VVAMGLALLVFQLGASAVWVSGPSGLVMNPDVPHLAVQALLEVELPCSG